MIIGIIGAGRFGTLLQKHLSTNNTVYVFDKNDDPSINLLTCELVIFAVPNKNLAEVVEQYKTNISTDAIVMDVGSVKVKPCEILRNAFGKNDDNHSLLGSHPLFGPDSAGESWQDHKMVFCRLDISDDKYEAVKELFTSRGVQAFECSPAEHDQMMAKTQALVHFIGRALTGIKPQDIATPDYANLLKMMEKVTNDTWELFFDMQNLNPYAEVERKRLLQAMTDLEKRIDIDFQNR